MENGDTVYIWLMSDQEGTGISAGRPAMGTLRDYAKNWESAYYTGENLPSLVLYTYEYLDRGPVAHQVSITRGPVDENDYISYNIDVNGETAIVRIDGRA